MQPTTNYPVGCCSIIPHIVHLIVPYVVQLLVLHARPHLPRDTVKHTQSRTTNPTHATQNSSRPSPVLSLEFRARFHVVQQAAARERLRRNAEASELRKACQTREDVYLFAASFETWAVDVSPKPEAMACNDDGQQATLSLIRVCLNKHERTVPEPPPTPPRTVANFFLALLWLAPSPFLFHSANTLDNAPLPSAPAFPSPFATDLPLFSAESEGAGAGAGAGARRERRR